MKEASAAQIAAQLHPVYQPIFDFRRGRRRLSSFECLTRGPTGTSPSEIFRLARTRGMERELDRICMAACLRDAPREGRLSLNVHASTLEDGRDFIEFLARTASAHRMPLSRIIVEVLEHRTLESVERLAATAVRLQSLGVAIALDDLGIGGSNFHMLIDLQPDIVKIDRFFIAGCDADPRRGAVVKAIASLCRSFDCAIVAEGVETPDEMKFVRDHRINMVQGFLLGRPQLARELDAAMERGDFVMPVGGGELPF